MSPQNSDFSASSLEELLLVFNGVYWFPPPKGEIEICLQLSKKFCAFYG